jgi:hypothetical protein
LPPVRRFHQHPVSIHDDQLGPEECIEIHQALAQVGMQAATVFREAHQVLTRQRQPRQIVMLGNRHVNEDVGLERVLIDRPLGDVFAVWNRTSGT